jgi:hypothetical protein
VKAPLVSTHSLQQIGSGYGVDRVCSLWIRLVLLVLSVGPITPKDEILGLL